MPDAEPARRVAIVGLGPRGLGAAEALAARAAETGTRVDLTAIDPGRWPGAGPNFRPDSSRLNLLNVPVHAIDLPPAAYPGASVPPFDRWPQRAGPDADRYPTRAELGRYLVARYEDLRRHPPQGLRITLLDDTALALAPDGGNWTLSTGSGRAGPFHEVLLTLGQPDTAADAQLARWREHAGRGNGTLCPAYPGAALSAAAAAWAGGTVAVRGLGLATLDVLRVLTLGQGGRFAAGRYCPSGREPARILPFSLDGQPPAPKPAGAALDATYDPTADETRAFAAALAEALRGPADAALDEICAALLPPVLRILAAGGAAADRGALARWLAVERDTPGAQEDRPAVQALAANIAIAAGKAPPDAGYAVGQLWRKWQTPLRQGFNPARIAPATAAAVIGFDEGLKRYSYGPPVASARELLALIEAGIVDLRAVEDPDIRLVADGWQLAEGDARMRAPVMVDAVLPSPSLEGAADPILSALRAAGRACPAVEGMGARIRADGGLVGSDGAVLPGLSLLGRMALGSVIAIDSIHDCFGAAAHRWADGVITRAAEAR
ncbi:hypothetical protein GE300_16595 [Rhodobacteraceae bacterium 2CG4]|uniref:FAD-dependent urate hydroxylase HpyO/Asp monooxygenase CreE-like FAD/NAD(P)-binding domain-containing protein n=1 Tax=Halovulum marinum TaxID=2662447 RepID=A0A6L5Z584_9RHOB|nr:FAD/NAD(P)-binding protein [Halovulum marinum]MSU91204.1 hypothetical protein [Halovulum marinum]